MEHSRSFYKVPDNPVPPFAFWNPPDRDRDEPRGGKTFTKKQGDLSWNCQIRRNKGKEHPPGKALLKKLV